MKKVLVVYEKESEGNYQSIWNVIMKKKQTGEYLFEVINISPDNLENGRKCLQNTNAEFIISFDMAGFQYKTLLDNYLYNIIPLKQLHLVTDKKIWEEYEHSEFALNAFIYIPDKEINTLQNSEENLNIRYYPEKWLEKSEELIERLTEDFIEALF